MWLTLDEWLFKFKIRNPKFTIISSVSHLLPELERIAREAGGIALANRPRGDFRLKPDGSIVTNGDIEVEKYLREVLPPLVPGTTVWGEEFGFSEPGEGGLWALDPIDGTSNFAFGSPLWGVSIALIQDGKVAFSALNLPDLGELYLAARGKGATLNGKPLPLIPPGPVLAHQLVSFNDHAVRALPGTKIPGKMRMAGAVATDMAITARPRNRGLIGVREKLYDIAAGLLILEELGADIRYSTGEPLVVGDLIRDSKIGRPWIVFPAESGFFDGAT